MIHRNDSDNVNSTSQRGPEESGGLFRASDGGLIESQPPAAAIQRLDPRVVTGRGQLRDIALSDPDPEELFRAPVGSLRAHAEDVIDRVGRDADVELTGFNRAEDIERLRKKGTVPPEVASYLHTLRVCGNKAEHKDNQIQFERRDLDSLLGLFLRVLKWYHCEFEEGPRQETIFLDLPDVGGIARSTILPGGAAYAGTLLPAGLLLDHFDIRADLALLALVVVALGLALVISFRKTRRLLGLRTRSAGVAPRFRAYSTIFFASLLVLLDAPLLTTSYTGIDPYGAFFAVEYAKAWTLVLPLLANFALAAVNTVLFLWIAAWWAKYHPTNINASTVTSVLIPLGIVYLVATLTQRVGIESYLIAAFFPLAVAFLAIVGYSHPGNQVEPFTAKTLFFLCIILMVVGFVLAMAGLLFMMPRVGEPVARGVFETHLWQRPIDWTALGLTAEQFTEKARAGFAWMVLAASFYLEVGVGVPTTLCIYGLQLKPALRREENHGDPA